MFLGVNVDESVIAKGLFSAVIALQRHVTAYNNGCGVRETEIIGVIEEVREYISILEKSDNKNNYPLAQYRQWCNDVESKLMEHVEDWDFGDGR